MPLRAEINGENIISVFMTDNEWKKLKERVKQGRIDIKMPCCSSAGHMRTSSRGLNHFAHNKRGVCTSSGKETWEHLKAKAEIVRACRDAEYGAITEAIGEGWRADVLATKGDNIKIAFEVQWSNQKLEETIERQQRYSDAGIRCCWFFRKPPNDFEARKELPLFQLEVTEDVCQVLFTPHKYEKWYPRFKLYPLSEFVHDILTYKLKFCETLRSKSQQKIKITFAEINCWKCHTPYHVWAISNLETYCKQYLNASDEMWGDDKLYFHPKIREAVAQFVNSPLGKHINISRVQKRYSKTVHKSYLSFGCPRCNAMCGDFFLSSDISYALENEDNPTTIDVLLELAQVKRENYNHWCYSEDGNFCC